MELEQKNICESSKKQKINEIRYFKTDCPQDARTWQGHRMYQNPTLTGIKKHVRTLRFDVFLILCAHFRANSDKG
ncbi:MAG: hypothetical protein II806_07015, partial [Bacteroidaceae bacterium]|nr:hypothetical protein [Bacteroidaceae bacterium]